MPGSNYSYSTGEFLNNGQYFDSPTFSKKQPVLEDVNEEQDNELMYLITTLYGGKVNPTQIAKIMQMAQNDPAYVDRLRDQARQKTAQGFNPNSGKQELRDQQYANYKKELWNNKKIKPRKADKYFDAQFEQDWQANEGARRQAYLNDLESKKKAMNTASFKPIEQPSKNVAQTGPSKEQAPTNSTPQTFKSNYWLKRAQSFNSAFKSIQDVIDWQTKHGLNPDGKFGEASETKWKQLNGIKSDSEKPENETPQVIPEAKITAQLDKTKANSTVPTYNTPTYNGSYKFDPQKATIEEAKAVMAREFRTNNIPRPLGGPGYNVMGEEYIRNYPYLHQQGGNIRQRSNNPIDMIIEALNGGADIQTVSGMIQQTGQDPQVIVKEIMARAQQGDQSAATALSNLEKLMQNSQSAKLGAKLAYIQKLKGICPEGSEKVYLRNGGCMCAQKAEKGTKTKVAYKDIDKKTYEKLPEKTRMDADRHYLGKSTSDNKDGSYNISHKPNASDSTHVDRKHMSPEMQKKYPLKKAEKKQCGATLKKKK